MEGDVVEITPSEWHHSRRFFGHNAIIRDLISAAPPAAAAAAAPEPAPEPVAAPAAAPTAIHIAPDEFLTHAPQDV